MTMVKYRKSDNNRENKPASRGSFFDDSLMRDFFSDLSGSTNRRVGMIGSGFNVNRTEDGYEIQAALPGVKKDELNVEVIENVLQISFKHAEGEGNMNRFVQEFTQRYQLGEEIDQESIEASLQDGVLSVKMKRLPEPESAKPRTIQIQ